MRKLIIYIGAAIAMLTTTTAKAQNGHYAGGDISLLPQYEASKTVYLDTKGEAIPDLVVWLKETCGWNTFRVRLFVNPKNSGTDDPAVCQDLDYVSRLGKRIKDAGGEFLLDFHYSDTWADPTKQKLPKEWSDCKTAAQKAERIYQYTKDALTKLKAAGAEPDLVQVGNETSYGMADIKVHPYDNNGDDWDGLIEAFKSGCRAVREVSPKAKIIIHTERSGNNVQTAYYYNKLKDVDYDIIGLSYYPFWHGKLTSLEATLLKLKRDFAGKQVHIVETAYPIQWWSDDAMVDTRSEWPVAEGKCDGQYAFLQDLIKTLAKYPQVDGLSWWCPEEAGSGDNANWDTKEGIVINGWMNRGMWWPTVGGNNGHWPLTTQNGATVDLIRTFLTDTSAGIGKAEADGTPATGSRRIYTISGQYAGNSIDGLEKGLYIRNNKKIIKN